MIELTDDIKLVCKEMPNFFDQYQAGIKDKKLRAALVFAYLGSVVEQGLSSESSDANYSPLYNNVEERGIINFPMNYVIDPFRNMVASILNVYPPISVTTPQIQDERKVAVAEIAQEALEYHDKQIFNTDYKTQVLLTTAIACGTAYRELFVEETPITFDTAGEGYTVRNGKAYDQFEKPADVPITKKAQVRLQTQIRTIWDVASTEDSETRLIDDCTIQVIKCVKNLGDIRKIATPEAMVAIAKTVQSKTAPIVDEFTKDLRTAKGLTEKRIMATLTEDDRQVVCLLVYHRLTAKYPDGWAVLMHKETGTIIKVDKLAFGRSPLTQLDTNNIDPSEFLKHSIFDDARGPQILIQGLLNSAASNAMLGANPPEVRWKGVITSDDKRKQKSIYPKRGEQREIDVDGWKQEAIQANPSLAAVFEPHFQNVPPLNQTAMLLIDVCEKVIRSVTGQNMSNIDVMPKQDISGESFRSQVEVDQMSNLPTIKLFYNFIDRARRQELRALRKVYPGTMLAYMLDEETMRKVNDFKADDIDDSYDVRVIPMDGIPSSPQARVNYFATLIRSAPTDAERMDIWMQMKKATVSMNLMPEEPDDDEELAKLENEMLINDMALKALMIPDGSGQLPLVQIMDKIGMPQTVPAAMAKVQGWANEVQMSDRHNKYHRPLVAGKAMIQNGPETAQLAYWHIKAHEQIEEIKMAEQQAMIAQQQRAELQARQSKGAPPQGAQ